MMIQYQYRKNNLPERCDEALLKKTRLTVKDNTDILGALQLNIQKCQLNFVRHY